MSEEAYKIIVYIPAEFSEELMDRITDVTEPFYRGYRRCFSISDAKGTWIPELGSKPYSGTIGEIETVDEKRIEFIVRREQLKTVLHVIEEVHPYEEPMVDVIPCLGWRSLL